MRVSTIKSCGENFSIVDMATDNKDYIVRKDSVKIDGLPLKLAIPSELVSAII